VGFSGTDAVLVQLDLLAEQNPQMLFVATNDTAEFVVAAIRYWLGQMGWPRYPGQQAAASMPRMTLLKCNHPAIDGNASMRPRHRCRG
jgi:hypothetical protein